MRHFIRMMERTRQTHTATRASFGTEPIYGPFWTQSFEKAHVIVFNDFSNKEVIEVKDVTGELDLPFECCAFECIAQGGILLSSDKYDKSGETDLEQIRILCMVVRETSPRKYACAGHFISRDKSGKEIEHLRAWAELDPKEQLSMFAFLERFLKELAMGEIGAESVREKVKIGTGSEKRFHTIRQVIRVMSRKDRESATPAFSREIDWSHRFRVRGHWRRVAGLGKDREGRYCVSGFTWVSDFVKGPEDKPLVEKVRVV